MKNGNREIISVRIVSCAFVVLALAIFKPFGLSSWQWQAYMHLTNIFLLGFITCLITDIILKYVVRMPRSAEHGVGYVIRRNLWFQLINTPIVSLIICLYRHFVLSDRMEGNQLSWSNYLQTLLIIAFCSFAIGLYWRFKYRSKFLEKELEETRLLNEQLKIMQEQKANPQPLEQPLPEKEEELKPEDTITLTGNTSETLTLKIEDLLYIEAVGNYVKVYHLYDSSATAGHVQQKDFASGDAHAPKSVRNDMLRATSKQMEDTLQAYKMIVRCHRAFLVNLRQVEQIVSRSGSMQIVIKHSHDSIPVSRSNMMQIKDAIKGM